VSDGEQKSPAAHLKQHQFPKGVSGNSGGRPKGLERMVRELVAAQKHADPERGEIDGWSAMTLRLYDIAMGKTNAKERDQIEAIKVLKDRGYGKARQTVDVTGDLRVGSAPVQLPPTLTDEQVAALATLDEGLVDDPDAGR
jgi:hypothetical protein